MYALAFERERIWVERAITENGGSMASAELVAEKARDIRARYQDDDGNLRQIVVVCVPDMTYGSVLDDMRRAMWAPSHRPPQPAQLPAN
jgi:hypothetical protein